MRAKAPKKNTIVSSVIPGQAKARIPNTMAAIPDKEQPPVLRHQGDHSRASLIRSPPSGLGRVPSRGASIQARAPSQHRAGDDPQDADGPGRGDLSKTDARRPPSGRRSGSPDLRRGPPRRGIVRVDPESRVRHTAFPEARHCAHDHCLRDTPATPRPTRADALEPAVIRAESLVLLGVDEGFGDRDDLVAVPDDPPERRFEIVRLERPPEVGVGPSRDPQWSRKASASASKIFR